MLTEIKLSRTQISEIVQFLGFLGSLLSKIVGPLIKLVVPMAEIF